MARRTVSLIHRGYLYAQKRVVPATTLMHTPSEHRMIVAKAYRDGYLAARRDAKKT